MKLRKPPTDGKHHIYCMSCRREMVRPFRLEGRTMYRCMSCNAVHPRALIIDPGINWWLGNDGEYWHETAGVFVRDSRSRFLFLERATYPFGLTVPAGHVDLGEAPIAAARRELFEETRLRAHMESLTFITTGNIIGDECRRGSDAHRWHVYAIKMNDEPALRVNANESLRAVWLDLDQALRAQVTFVVRTIISRHGQEILAATQ